jgi:hypothetical protein
MGFIDESKTISLTENVRTGVEILSGHQSGDFRMRPRGSSVTSNIRPLHDKACELPCAGTHSRTCSRSQISKYSIIHCALYVQSLKDFPSTLTYGF